MQRRKKQPAKQRMAHTRIKQIIGVLTGRSSQLMQFDRIRSKQANLNAQECAHTLNGIRHELR